MNNQLNYKIIELHLNNQRFLQTLGLYDLLGVELRMQPVINDALTRGMISQIARHLLTLSTAPSLFNDPWIQYIFKENKDLCLLPFVLLESEDICHIIVPDSNGYYPWQVGCHTSFITQVDEALLLSNMLALIKSFFLTHLILDVSLAVYAQIGMPINIDCTTSLGELPDYLASLNLDMFIALTLSFNQTMPKVNHFVMTACQSIPLILTAMSDPIALATDIALKIYSPAIKEQYVSMIMTAFHKLTES